MAPLEDVLWLNSHPHGYLTPVEALEKVGVAVNHAATRKLDPNSHNDIVVTKENTIYEYTGRVWELLEYV